MDKIKTMEEMKKKFRNAVAGFLIKIKVLKSRGKYSNGEYITNRLNRRNPISYILLFILGIILFFIGGVQGFLQAWDDVWAS